VELRERVARDARDLTDWDLGAGEEAGETAPPPHSLQTLVPAAKDAEADCDSDPVAGDDPTEGKDKVNQEEGYYPDDELLSGVLKPPPRDWALAEIVEVGRQVGEPSDGDLETGEGKRIFLVKLAERLACFIVVYLLNSGLWRLTPRAIAEMIKQSGEIFLAEGGSVYHYARSKGVYELCTKPLERAFVALCERYNAELGQIRIAAGAWGTKRAASLLKALPSEVTPASLIRACEESLYRHWQVDEQGLNGNQWILNLKNGLLDLRTLVLRTHTPEHLCTVQLPYEYDPEARCPNFLSYLAAALPDPELRATLQEFVGYCLIPTTHLEMALFLAGPGGTGKSTFIKTLRQLVGVGNTSSVALDDLADKFRVGEIRDRLLNVATEVNPHKALHDARFKAFVSGDPVMGERKFEQASTFEPFARFVISANALPRVKDLSDAVFRRLLVVKFEQKFVADPNPEADPPELPRDPNLEAKIRCELGGILNWALEGLSRLREREDFARPAKMMEYIEEYRQEQNNVLRFVSDACHMGPGYEVGCTEAYRRYGAWCKEQGEKAVPNNTFGVVVRTVPGVKAHRTGNKGRHFLGFRPVDA
jgi:P4 family phage/plasmid primase-like protien